MEKPGIALRVLIGLVCGIALGLALMTWSPLPMQAGDKYSLEADGQKLTITLAKPAPNTDPIAEATLGEGGERPDWLKLPTDAPLVGQPISALQRALGTARPGLESSPVRLEQRGEVTERPWPTTVVYALGQIFLRLLRMIVLPLIVATVVVGIASLGDIRRLGRIGRQTAVFYLCTMTVAVSLGIFMVNTIRPGDGLNWSLPKDSGVQNVPTAVDLILRVIPTNPFQALSEFDVLGAMFFAIILALAILKVGKHRAAPVFNLLESLSDLTFVIVGWIMRLAPIGVGGLVAYYLAIQEPGQLGQLFASLGKYAATVAGGQLVHFAFLVFLVHILGKYPFHQFLRQTLPAITTAFGTSSSNATMPVTMACVQDMGVSKRISAFVVPVGATMNMDGTALFEVVAVLFFAQAYGVDLSIGQQMIVALTAMLAAVGAAGIPSAGLVMMTIVLTAVGLPIEGIGLLLAIDRPLDMARTVVNVTGDTAACRIVQTWNPDLRIEEDDQALEYEMIEPSASHGP